MKLEINTAIFQIAEAFSAARQAGILKGRFPNAAPFRQKYALMQELCELENEPG